MIDQRTTFTLAVLKKGQEYDFYRVLQMHMEGYPEPTLKKLVIYKDGIEQTIPYKPKNMFVTENINQSVLKIQVIELDSRVEINTNRPMNNIEILGFIELGKAQFIKTMYDNINRKQAAQN